MAAIAAGRAAGGEATDAVGDTGKKVSARCLGDLIPVFVSHKECNQPPIATLARPAMRNAVKRCDL